MTGPDHYCEAERLLHLAQENGYEPAQCTAMAQVHATLALAAATALNDAQGGMGDRDWGEWRRTASVNPPADETRGSAA